MMGAVKVIGVTGHDAEENLVPGPALARDWAHKLDSAVAATRSGRGGVVLGGMARVRAALRSAFSRLTEGLSERLPGIIAALALLLATWAVAKGLRRSIGGLSRRFRAGGPARDLLVRHLVYYTVWVVGLLLVLNALGVPIQGLVAGLGVTGLALGIGLREIIANFLSGVILLAFRPFTLGDEIEVKGVTGWVARIELRATSIRTNDGRSVIVPNADLLTSIVSNNTAAPMRRGEIRCPLSYADDAPRAMRLLGERVQGVPGVADEPPVAVRLEELGANEIWVRVTFWSNWRKVDLHGTRDAAGLAVLQALTEGGFTLPNPQQRQITIDGEQGTVDRDRGRGDARRWARSTRAT
jgi:small-conductance mechanosensitive channel